MKIFFFSSFCLLIYLTKIILGILSTVLAFSIFFINQMKFLKSSIKSFDNSKKYGFVSCNSLYTLEHDLINTLHDLIKFLSNLKIKEDHFRL